MSDFTKDFPMRERSLEEAIQILYSKFGDNIPAVNIGLKEWKTFFVQKIGKVVGLKTY